MVRGRSNINDCLGSNGIIDLLDRKGEREVNELYY